MFTRTKKLLMTALLSFSASHAVLSQAQQAGPLGQPTGGMQPQDAPSSTKPADGDPRSPGKSTRDSGVPSGFSGGDNRGTNRATDGLSGDHGLPGAPPEMSRRGVTTGRVVTTVVVPLSDVVTKVQERFNATAVKTDSVLSLDGKLSYRIRLLSADKSRVWTVSVDASTGQVK